VAFFEGRQKEQASTESIYNIMKEEKGWVIIDLLGKEVILLAKIVANIAIIIATHMTKPLPWVLLSLNPNLIVIPAQSIANGAPIGVSLSVSK